MKNDRLIPKSEILKILKIDRKKFEELVSDYDLPMVQITPYKKYVRESHLKEYLDKNTVNLPKSKEELHKEESQFEWRSIWNKKK